MKNLIAALALVAAAPAMAIPDVVSWTGRVENDAGPFDGTLSVTFALFDVFEAGTPLWSESVSSADVTDGELIHELGSIEPLDDALLDRDNLFLQVTMNGDVLAPRSALRAVPYSMRSHDADVAELALLAEDATTLGGFAPASFQFTAAAGGGLALTGTQFSIAAGSISTARLADGAVTSAKIAAGAVTAAHIANGAVTTTQLAANAVTSAQIANGTVVADDIGNGAIGSSKLAANAVTSAAVDNGAIIQGKIAGGAIVSSNLSGNKNSVRVQPAACGGDLQLRTFTQGPGPFFIPIETTTCRTDPCGVSGTSLRFKDCGGACTSSVIPITCEDEDYGPLVGSLVFAP